MKVKTIVVIVSFLLFSVAAFNLRADRSEVKLISGELKASPVLNNFLNKIGALDSKESLFLFFGVEDGSYRALAERIEPFTHETARNSLMQTDHVDGEILKENVPDYNSLAILVRGTHFAARRTLSLEKSYGSEMHEDLIQALMMLGQVENETLADEFAVRISAGDLTEVRKDMLSLESGE